MQAITTYYIPGSVLSAIEAADAKINAGLGYTSNTLAGWWATLTKTGSVEVGWRECCGTTHMTAKHRAEWLKIVKKLEKGGVRLLVERVKHKNGYATNNGGFWNSEIFRLPSAASTSSAQGATKSMENPCPTQ